MHSTHKHFMLVLFSLFSVQCAETNWNFFVYDAQLATHTLLDFA